MKELVKVVRRHNDGLELFVVTGLMSLLAALGIMLSFAVVTGADVLEWDCGIAVGIYFMLTGVIWSVLIIKNC